MSEQTRKLKGPDLSEPLDRSTLNEQEPFLGHFDGKQVVLVREGEIVYAVGAQCTHYGGPLNKGIVGDGFIRCPWHHAHFCLKDGSARGPALDSIPCYEVVHEGETVRIERARESKRPPAPQTEVKSIVIVGAGAAGNACAETLRRCGFDRKITLVGGGEPWPVDRPNLSKDYLAGKAEEDWLPVREPDFYDEIGVDFVRAHAETVRPKDKLVELDDGTTHPYDVLILAPGASPRRLPIEGADADHVFTLRTLDDANALIGAAESAASAVVIGAGFIGLEAAASLRKRGLDVTVVAPDSTPLARIVGEQLGHLIRSVHEDNGVRFRLETKPTKIAADHVKLDDGSSVDADLVVLGVGVSPRVELAEAAGLDIENGVLVDEHYSTSDPAIYAIGDIANFPYRGERVRIEHWAVAERQGQELARILCGEPAGKQAPFFWSWHFDLAFRYVGHASDWDELVVDGSIGDRDAIVGFRKDGKILAVADVGRAKQSLEAGLALERGDDDALNALFG